MHSMFLPPSFNTLWRTDETEFGFLTHEGSKTREAESWAEAYGKDRDGRQRCRMCYNDHTDRVRDLAVLKPYVEYHKSQNIVVMECWVCTHVWHWKKEE